METEHDSLFLCMRVVLRGPLSNPPGHRSSAITNFWKQSNRSKVCGKQLALFPFFDFLPSSRHEYVRVKFKKKAASGHQRGTGVTLAVLMSTAKKVLLWNYHIVWIERDIWKAFWKCWAGKLSSMCLSWIYFGNNSCHFCAWLVHIRP